MKALMIALALLLLLTACNQSEPPSAGVSLHAELGGSSEGYERACGPRAFNFPADHSAHSSFRNEWWYITGNLQNENGKRFGFHITFFRIANQPQTEATTQETHNSHWASNEFYMAHFAVTPEAGAIKTYERFSRAAAGLAGASPGGAGEAGEGKAGTQADDDNVTRVWLDDWQLQAKQEGDQLIWHLDLNESDLKLNLQLDAVKPLVLQGDAGYSQKSADPCNASFYYSYTNLATSGTLQFDGITHLVDGNSWFDREWSSSALGDNQSGWDWFAIQLDDGREIMLYQLRLNDGRRDAYSHAVEISRTGQATEIPIENIDLTITRWWQSETGSRYPVAGQINRKDTGETLAFEPLVNDQLLDLTVRYWEGAISLTDAEDKPIGRGYMELTGY